MAGCSNFLDLGRRSHTHPPIIYIYIYIIMSGAHRAGIILSSQDIASIALMFPMDKE